MEYSETFIVQRVEKFLVKNASCYYGERSPLSATFTAAEDPIPFAEIGKRTWKPIQPGERWGSQWKSAWFRFTGGVPSRWKGSEVVAVIDTGGEGCVFDRGGNPFR